MIFSEELGAAFFPTEAWGQPLTFDLGPAGLHHPALLHTALHGPPMVGAILSPHCPLIRLSSHRSPLRLSSLSS